jgi:hypothetical protein
MMVVIVYKQDIDRRLSYEIDNQDREVYSSIGGVCGVLHAWHVSPAPSQNQPRQLNDQGFEAPPHIDVTRLEKSMFCCFTYFSFWMIYI